MTTENGSQVVMPKWLWLVFIGAVGWALNISLSLQEIKTIQRERKAIAVENKSDIAELTLRMDKIREEQLKRTANVYSIQQLTKLLTDHETRIRELEKK